MGSSKLESLPLHLLEDVSSYLEGTHKPSLYAISLASKTCRNASFRSLFRQIYVTVDTREGIKRDMDTLTKILVGCECVSYVHHISIKGRLVVGAEKPQERELDTEWTRTRSTPFRHYRDEYKLSGLAEILPDKEPGFHEPPPADNVITVSQEENEAWLPFVKLVETIPKLTKLVYDCSNQFPPCLLDAIHRHQPQCKIHHLTFRIRSLLEPVIDPHEMAVATSPCLHNVTARYIEEQQDYRYHADLWAVMELVSGLSPNLKEVSMIMHEPRLRQHFGTSAQRPRRTLPGYVAKRASGKLTSLSIQGEFATAKPPLISVWAQFVDFRCLRRLELGSGHNGADGLDDLDLEWFSQNLHLPHLRVLGLCLSESNSRSPVPEYTDRATAFFRGLEPLDELTVRGVVDDQLLTNVLARHGPSLKKFVLREARLRGVKIVPYLLGTAGIDEIQRTCPRLEDLQVAVERSRSDESETQMYRRFGKMEHLQRLFLTLDCVQLDLGDCGGFDQADSETFSVPHFSFGANRVVRCGHVRKSLMNCAVDEALARSIWDTICENKMGKRLNYLKLYTANGGCFSSFYPITELADIVQNLSRAWLIEGVRDDGQGIVVKELGRGARETRDLLLTKSGGASLSDNPKGLDIFRRIWPAREGSKDWREDWVSIPLRT